MLGVTTAIYWLILSRRWRIIYLNLVSLLWIWYWQKEAAMAVLVLTVITYLFGLWLEKGTHKLVSFRLGILFLVMALIGSKYMGLISSTLNLFYSRIPEWGNNLPVILGFSYLVFKYISYLTDMHWGLIKSAQPFELLCFGSIFTLFSAGPMERFEGFSAQLRKMPERFNARILESGIIRICEGLFLKLVLADWLAYLSEPVWTSPDIYSNFVRILAFWGYGLRIYFDFAGYSGIAIGASRLLGFTTRENFDNPYLSANITEFWRKWHISLSNWIRDYLFFPLSQNRTNQFWLRWMVPVLAMLVCGIWHGAAWHFALWGLWHGFGIAFYQMWQRNRRKYKKADIQGKNWFSKLPGNLINFSFVNLGWLLFHAEGKAMAAEIFDPLSILVLLLVGAVVLTFLKSFKQFSEYALSIRWRAAYALVLTFMFYCGMNTGFIYAKF